MRHIISCKLLWQNTKWLVILTWMNCDSCLESEWVRGLYQLWSRMQCVSMALQSSTNNNRLQTQWEASFSPSEVCVAVPPEGSMGVSPDCGHFFLSFSEWGVEKCDWLYVLGRKRMSSWTEFCHSILVPVFFLDWWLLTWIELNRNVTGRFYKSFCSDLIDLNI